MIPCNNDDVPCRDPKLINHSFIYSFKLLLPHNLYSGTKHVTLFSQWPFHFRVCLIVLWHPFSCVNSNTII